MFINGKKSAEAKASSIKEAEQRASKKIINSVFYEVTTNRKLQKKLKNIDILVFRQSKSGIKNSKPCKDCIQTMKSLNINKVYYSSDSGILICEKINNITSEHLSQLSRVRLKTIYK